MFGFLLKTLFGQLIPFSYVTSGPTGVWGRMAIYFQVAGEHWLLFSGIWEQAHSFGVLGSPAKKVLKVDNDIFWNTQNAPDYTILIKRNHGEACPRTSLAQI